MLGDSWIGVSSRGTPYWVLWRRVARALGQVLACLAYGQPSPAGGSAGIGDRGVEGVLPKVIGLPPGDLIQQVRLGSAMQCCCGEDGVLELLVLPTAERRFGQEPLPQAFQLQRVSAA